MGRETFWIILGGLCLLTAGLIFYFRRMTR